MGNPCFMVGSFFAVFFALCCAVLWGIAARGGYRAGFSAGFETARARFAAILEKAKARDILGDLWDIDQDP